MKSGGVVAAFNAPSGSLVRETLRVIPAFLIGTLLHAVFYRLDFVVLSLFEPVEQIGYYAIAYRLFEISIVVTTAVVMAIFPWVSRQFVVSAVRFRVAAASAVVAFGTALVAASFAGIVGAETYVALLFPEQYPAAVLLTQCFMAALFLGGIDYVASAILHASDQQTADTSAMACGAIVNLVLLVYLVPQIGVFGAFSAKVVASVLQLSIKFFCSGRVVGRLLESSQVLRVFMVATFAGLLALAFVDQGLLARMGIALLVSVAVIPLIAIVSGLLQPLRALRFFREPRTVHDVDSVADLLDALADAQRWLP